MGIRKNKRRIVDLEDGKQAVEDGVVWLDAASTVPTVGRAGQVGLFVEGGVLKAILPDNSVELVAYEA